MREYDELTYRHARTMREAFGTSDYEIEEETPHWFEIILYVIKSILSGIGIIALTIFIGYWSTK